jgi:hypothetical protein
MPSGKGLDEGLGADTTCPEQTGMGPGVLNQELPGRHPGLVLEDLEKRLKETPSYKTFERCLVQGQIDRLKARIRREAGLDEPEPQRDPELPKQVMQEAKNAETTDRGRTPNDGRSKLPEPLRVGGIPQPPKLGVSGHAGAERGGPTSRSAVAGAECTNLARAKFTAHFGVVPVTDDMKRGLDRIREGFARAKDALSRSGQNALAREVDWFETRYTQAYLESETLPQALKIAKRAADAGYCVVVARERSRKLERRVSIQPSQFVNLDDLDRATSGCLKRILPEFRDAFAALQAQFGNVADYCGDAVDYERMCESRREFLAGRLRIIYAAYGAATVPFCDADYPELGIVGGSKPRVSIFLAPPHSGHLVMDAALLTWRASIKSDVHAVFLSTDSSRDAELLQQKVGPLLRAIGATVVGERISVSEQFSAMTEGARETALEAALAFAEGKVQKVGATMFQVRSKNRQLMSLEDWSQINFPPAESAKRKQCITAKKLLDSEVRDQYLSAFGIEARRDRSSSADHNLQELSGVDFEKLIAALLARMGFLTEMTRTSGDGGIDIVAKLDKPVIGGRFLVQCKRYAPGNLVGAPTVRDFYGAVTADRGMKGILITTSDFTVQAREFAQRVGVELIPLGLLKSLLSENGLKEMLGE